MPNKKIKKRIKAIENTLVEHRWLIKYCDVDVRKLKRSMYKLTGNEDYEMTSTEETPSTDSLPSTPSSDSSSSQFWYSTDFRVYYEKQNPNYYYTPKVFLLLDNYVLRTKKFYYTMPRSAKLCIYFSIAALICLMIVVILIVIAG